jgi:hypothetical protein
MPLQPVRLSGSAQWACLHHRLILHPAASATMASPTLVDVTDRPLAVHHLHWGCETCRLCWSGCEERTCVCSDDQALGRTRGVDEDCTA